MEQTALRLLCALSQSYVEEVSCFDASSENALTVGIWRSETLEQDETYASWKQPELVLRFKEQHTRQPQPQNLKFSACTMDSRSQGVPKAQRSRSISSQQSTIKGDTGAHAVTSLGPASLRKSASPRKLLAKGNTWNSAPKPSAEQILRSILPLSL